MKKGVITVITQTYNCEEFIEQCIESVLGQTYADIDYVIIDNGSTDKTGQLIDKYVEQDSRIRLIKNEENLGYDFFINNIKNIVEGEYFTIVDGDDYLDRDFAKKTLELITDNDVDICCTYTNVTYEDRTEILSNNIDDGVIPKEKYGENILTFTQIEHIWAKVFKSQLLEQFDSHFLDMNVEAQCGLGMDSCTWWELLGRSNGMIMLKEPVHNYRVIKDISYAGYQQRLPYAYRCFPINLMQVHEFLRRVNGISSESLRVIFDEYIGKIEECIYSVNSSDQDYAEKMTFFDDLLEWNNKCRLGEIKAKICDDSRYERGYSNFQLTADMLSKVHEKYNELFESRAQIGEQLREKDAYITEALYAKDKYITELQSEKVKCIAEIASEKDQIIQEREATIVSQNDIIAQKDLELNNRGEIINQQSGIIADREQVIADREQVIADREQVIADREQVIAGREQVIADKDSVIEELTTKLRQRDMQINSLAQSRMIRHILDRNGIQYELEKDN